MKRPVDILLPRDGFARGVTGLINPDRFCSGSTVYKYQIVKAQIEIAVSVRKCGIFYSTGMFKAEKTDCKKNVTFWMYTQPG